MKLMLQALQDGTADRALESATPRQLVRMACLVRNTSVTYGGKTPLELALGRRPADILDVERSNPQVLTSDLLPSERTAQAVRKLAMKIYLEARQAADLRQDIASHLKFDQGPFYPGEKVWYWNEDKSKIKSSGEKSGQWLRAKLLTIDGAMAGIDLGSRIVRVS